MCTFSVVADGEWISRCGRSCIAGMAEGLAELSCGVVVELRRIHSSNCELSGE